MAETMSMILFALCIGCAQSRLSGSSQHVLSAGVSNPKWPGDKAEGILDCGTVGDNKADFPVGKSCHGDFVIGEQCQDKTKDGQILENVCLKPMKTKGGGWNAELAAYVKALPLEGAAAASESADHFQMRKDQTHIIGWVLDKAQAAQQDLKQQVEALVKKTTLKKPESCQVSVAPDNNGVKSWASSIAKVCAQWSGGDPLTLSDACRITIIADPVDVNTLSKAVSPDEKTSGLTGFEFSFKRDTLNEPDTSEFASGYGDINFRVRHQATSLLCEVQVHNCKLAKAKGGEGHKIYEDTRKITRDKGMPNQKDLPKDYPLEEVKALYKKSKDLYKAALDDKGACAMIDAAALKKFEEITFGEIYTNLFIGGSGVERIKKLKKSKTM